MSAVLEARGLTRDYSVSRGAFRSRATIKALAGVSFSLQAGRTLAVVGESGSGKSTLARLLTLIENPTAGSLLIDGEDVAHASAATRQRLRREIQIVFQNPYGSLNPRQTIGKALEEPLLVNTDLERRRAQGRGSVDHGQGGLEARILSSLPAHVLGRPAPAHRHRPRAHAEAEDPGARRAGVGAGRFDPRPGAQPARQLAGGICACLCVRLARSFGRAPHRRRGDGDLSRQCGRARRARAQSSTARSIPTRRRSCPRRRSPTRPPSASASCFPASRHRRSRRRRDARFIRAARSPSIAAAPRSRRSSASRGATSPAGLSRHERRRPTISSSSAPARPAACSPIG